MPSMSVTEFPSADGLLAGDFPRRMATVTIAAGLQLPAGAVLGLDGTEYKPATPGEEGEPPTPGIAPSVVLFEAIDTTAGAGPGLVMLCGDVRAEALTVAEGLTLDAVRWALRPYCLFVR